MFTGYISSSFYYDEVLSKTGKYYGELILVLSLIVGMRIVSILISIFHTIVTSTIGGNALGTKNYWGAILVFVITLAISAAGLLFYDRLCDRKQKEKENSSISDSPESHTDDPPRSV